MFISTSPRPDGLSASAARRSAVSVCSTYDTYFLYTSDLPFAAVGVDDLASEWVQLDELIASASVVVLAAPVHRSRVAGYTYHVVEHLRSGLVGGKVIPIVAAGSERAHLAAVEFRNILWSNFGAEPTEPIVVTDDLGADELDQRFAAALANCTG